MIRSPDNPKLKTIRKLRTRRGRSQSGLFAAEGEDLVAAAEASGAEPVLLLHSGEDVEPGLLDAVSSLGSGTRVLGVYEQRWSTFGDARLALYLHGVRDPGNVGTIIRSAHALCDGPVILGPGCADPYSTKAVRASMGSIFARPPARAQLTEIAAPLVALDASADAPLGSVALGSRAVLCLGGERSGLPSELRERAAALARIPMREDGAESLNVSAAAAVALYETANRMAADA